MLNDLLRTVGAACIIAGTALYFTLNMSDESEIFTENEALKEEIISLQSNIERTEEELANLQTLTEQAKKSTDELTEEQQVEDDDEVSVIKTVLVIESGTTSKDVANRLEESAIIEDAELLNAFLTSNDLSGKIQIGEYHLDSSMSIQAIAKHITTLN